MIYMCGIKFVIGPPISILLKLMSVTMIIAI